MDEIDVAVENPGFDLEALRREFVGRVLSANTPDSKDKGALGKHVEALLRQSQQLSHMAWSSPTAACPDMGDWEIKTITCVEGAKSGWRVKEDLAIASIGKETFKSSFRRSPVAAKMRILCVALAKAPGGYRVMDLQALDLTRLPSIDREFKKLARVYWRLGGHANPARAIDLMTAANGGRCESLIAKTKGPRLPETGLRRRASYVRARQMTRVMFRPMATWPRGVSCVRN